MAFSINTNNIVDLGTLPISGYPFALTGWFRVPDVNKLLSLIRIENSSTGSYHEIIYAGSWTKYAGAYTFVSVASIAKSTITMTPGKWQHVTGLFISDSIRRVYLDGENLGTSYNPRVFDGADRFYLGNKRGVDFVDVAEAAVIAGTLDVAEIKQLALGASVLALPCAGNIVTYQSCAGRLNQPGLGPVASSGQALGVVDHPRVFAANPGRSAAMPFRRRGPLNLDRGVCQTSFSEQAELAVAGVDSDNTLYYGKALS